MFIIRLNTYRHLCSSISVCLTCKRNITGQSYVLGLFLDSLSELNFPQYILTNQWLIVLGKCVLIRLSATSQVTAIPVSQHHNTLMAAVLESGSNVLYGRLHHCVARLNSFKWSVFERLLCLVLIGRGWW